MARKKQQILRIGLYTLNDAVDTWLRDETADYGMELVTKNDDDLDVVGFDAVLLTEVQNSQRAEDLYMIAQDLISQGIHVIWACSGEDEWFAQVSKQMGLKNQTVIEIGQYDDATKLLTGLIELREAWQSKLSEPEEVAPEETIVAEKKEDALNDGASSEVAATKEMVDVLIDSGKGKVIQEVSPPKVPVHSSYQKIMRKLAPVEGTRVQPVVKEKFIRVGTTFIALVNASSGSGCTYSAIQIGLYLRRFSKSVAVIELRDEMDPRKGSFRAFLNSPEGSIEDPAFHLNGIDFVSTSKLSSFLKNKQYEYVILDIGALHFYDSTGNMKQNKHIDELERATVGCVTATGSPWGAYDLSQFLINFDDHRLEWNILLQHPSAEQKNDLVREFQSISDSYQILGIPYQPDPFVLEEETANELKQLLRQVIPQDEKKSAFKRLFAR